MTSLHRASQHHANYDSHRIPGTVDLVDSQNADSYGHGVDSANIILVPTPSDDPDDPLNWSRSRKMLSLINLCLFVVTNGMAVSVVYSILVPLSEALDVSVSIINSGTGYLFLLAGLSCLITQPFALQYGKRPTYIISLLGLMAVSLWSPYAHGNGQWIARSIVAGFFCSPIESLPEISISDLYFIHERGTYMSIYALMLAGSNYAAPIYCGFVNDALGYQWVFYLQAIFCGVGAVFLFFFMEETNYNRASAVLVEREIISAPEPGDKHEVINKEEDKSPQRPYQSKTYIQKLKLWDKPRKQRIPYRFWLGIRFLTWPVIAYAGFSYGSYLIYFNILNATASIILGGAPYNFSPSIVGLCYIAPVLGVLAASIFTGTFGDWLNLKLVRRNDGVFEPELRLHLFLATTILLPASMILWGVGAAHQVHWIGLLIAMASTAFANAVGITLSVNYAIDSYKHLAGDAMPTVIVIRNVMSFAIGYGITPWVDNLGLQNCFISVAFVALAICSVYLLMIWKGKRLRERSSVKYWALVKKHDEAGMIH